MRPARDIATECAPRCLRCDGTGQQRGIIHACRPCHSTGRLGVDDITAAIEADRAEMMRVVQEGLADEVSVLLPQVTELNGKCDAAQAEVAAIRAQLDEAMDWLGHALASEDNDDTQAWYDAARAKWTND